MGPNDGDYGLILMVTKSAALTSRPCRYDVYCFLYWIISFWNRLDNTEQHILSDLLLLKCVIFARKDHYTEKMLVQIMRRICLFIVNDSSDITLKSGLTLQMCARNELYVSILKGHFVYNWRPNSYYHQNDLGEKRNFW